MNSAVYNQIRPLRARPQMQAQSSSAAAFCSRKLQLILQAEPFLSSIKPCLLHLLSPTHRQKAFKWLQCCLIMWIEIITIRVLYKTGSHLFKLLQHHNFRKPKNLATSRRIQRGSAKSMMTTASTTTTLARVTHRKRLLSTKKMERWCSLPHRLLRGTFSLHHHRQIKLYSSHQRNRNKLCNLLASRV